ncbi:SH3 domain-containing protein [Streptomyces sp. NPDC050617]|uniref:SH3 domain-containing protein n=1 Tax=Streptomyces sp. NPDC050617 TaxID=3154628 RepID=UPI003423FC8A
MSMTPTLATLVTRGRKAAAGVGALATAAALGATLLGAAPAQASPTPSAPAMAPPAKPYGTVVTQRDDLIERQYPSTDSSPRGSLKRGAQVGLRCKVHAQKIENRNTIWYLLRDRPTWVTAAYVNNTGAVKYCKDVQRGIRLAPGKHYVG